MDFQLFAQLANAVLLALAFLVNLYTDFHGRRARTPGGFQGAILTMLISGVVFGVHYLAGAFSRLF